MALVFSPVLYWLTVKALKDNFTTDFERELLPSKLMFAWAWFGVIALVGITIWVLYSQFFM
jgi:hypothetical protein